MRRGVDTYWHAGPRHALTAEHVQFLKVPFAVVLKEYVPAEDLGDAVDTLHATVEVDRSAIDL